MSKQTDKVIENLAFTSDRLSTQVRTISIGVLSIVWLFLSADKDIQKQIGSYYSPSLFAIAQYCILSLLLDFMQYVFSYLDHKFTQKKPDGVYDNLDFRYRIKVVFFWMKMLPTFIASFWIIYILWNGLRT